MARVPYNKLLTNLAGSSCAGEYWPLVVLERIRLYSARTATISGQFSPVWPSRSVSKRLVLDWISVIYLVNSVVYLAWGLRPFYKLSLAFLLHPRFHLCIIAEIVINK